MTTYPHAVGFVRHSDTSAESARLLEETGAAGEYDTVILRQLARLGAHGATADEMTDYMVQFYPHIHNGTVAGRLSTMIRAGTVLKTTGRRITKSNRQAAVHVHAGLRGSVEEEPALARVNKLRAKVASVSPERKALEMVRQAAQETATGGAIIQFTPLEYSIFKNLMEKIK